YPKGALVLRMLLRYLGPERFWASLHTYLTRHALENATTDDLRQAVLDATGENLDWFWRQWIYDAGHPRFAVTAAYDTAARKLTLTVKQTQADSGKADSTGLAFETPKVFRMPVTIRVGTASGDVVRRAELAAREQTIEIPELAGAPPSSRAPRSTMTRATRCGRRRSRRSSTRTRRRATALSPGGSPHPPTRT